VLVAVGIVERQFRAEDDSCDPLRCGFAGGWEQAEPTTALDEAGASYPASKSGKHVRFVRTGDENVPI
jgi:hypothetical protein